MKVIIFAYSTESHAAPVKWALEQAGYEVACRAGFYGLNSNRLPLLLNQKVLLVCWKNAWDCFLLLQISSRISGVFLKIRNELI